MVYRKELTEDVLIYIINSLGRNIEGRKKLMKIMFFINYLDNSLEKLQKEPRVGNKFIVYHYGPFSFEVSESYIKLVKEEIIEDGFPIKLKKMLDNIEIPLKIKEYIDLIIEKFRDLSGYELEILSLKLLGIDKKTKKNFFNKDVREIIK